MEEFELDNESTSRAKQISSSWIETISGFSRSNFRGDGSTRIFNELITIEKKWLIQIWDVVKNVELMALELSAARKSRVGKLFFLKLDGGEFALIPFNTHLQPFRHRKLKNLFWNYRLEGVPLFPFRDATKEFQRDVVAFDAQEAEQTIQKGLEGFLSYRFAGVKYLENGGGKPIDSEWKHGETGSSSSIPRGFRSYGSLEMEVSCSQSSLRIHFSPAYFLEWEFFGHPSTPVRNFIPPGRYIFGGDGPGMNGIEADSGVFKIPPTYHAHLTRF